MVFGFKSRKEKIAALRQKASDAESNALEREKLTSARIRIRKAKSRGRSGTVGKVARGLGRGLSGTAKFLGSLQQERQRQTRPLRSGSPSRRKGGETVVVKVIRNGERSGDRRERKKKVVEPQLFDFGRL